MRRMSDAPTSSSAPESPFSQDLFAGQVVFVTGGATGIGKEICRSFGRAGARIAIASRKQEVLEAAKAELEGEGFDVWIDTCDVRDAGAVQRVVDGLVAHYGQLDVVVNNAAGNFPAPITSISPNGFKAVVDIDLNGSFNVLRAAHPHLRKPGAAVVNISAPQAVHAMPGQAHVCAAKAGVDMLTRVLAIEWGGDGIRINSVIPGPTEGTEGMARLAPTPERMQAVAKGVPLRRLGKKQDVANLAMFLASPWADYITGAVIPVDGGWSTNGAAGLT
jgi:NAD(P)-dependent dehydrogenase (short-subunit alcohol dehydrogenase family)